MMVTEKQFGAAVRDARKRRGWTQRKLAEKAGMSQSHVSSIESGRNYPLFFTAQILADVLGMTLGQLLEEGARL